MISGMGDYAYQLANALQRLDADVTVLTSDSHADHHDAPHGPRILRTVPSWNRHGFPAIMRAVETHAPDVVHLQFMTSTFQYEWAIQFLPWKLRKRFPKLKVITTFHEFAAPLGRTLLIPLLYGSDAFIVTNDHHFRRLSEIKKIMGLKQPLLRIPLAATILPVDGYLENREKTRRQLGFSPEEIVLLRFGIIHDLSTPEIVRVLRILADLRRKNLPVKLLLIGKSDSGLQTLVSEIRAHGLQDHVLIKTDLAPEFISAYLYASDIGLALYPDGVSEKRTAFLSLLGHGLPVLGIKTGIFPSELEAGKNILTVEAHATDAQWSEKISLLVQNAALRKEIGEAGSLVARLHQWPRIAESTKNIYQLLLK